MEDAKNTGRPRIGPTKKLSITMPDPFWTYLEEEYPDESISAAIRDLIMKHYKEKARQDFQQLVKSRIEEVHKKS